MVKTVRSPGGGAIAKNKKIRDRWQQEILRDAGVIRDSGAADNELVSGGYGKSACIWIEDQLVYFRLVY